MPGFFAAIAALIAATTGIVLTAGKRSNIKTENRSTIGAAVYF